MSCLGAIGCDALDAPEPTIDIEGEALIGPPGSQAVPVDGEAACGPELVVPASPLPERGYNTRACGFDLDRDGIVGEPEDCNLCDGSTNDGDDNGANTIYVSCAKGADTTYPAGDDYPSQGTCGSPEQPCETIARAIELAAASSPTSGADEDVICFRNICVEENLSPPAGHGGFPDCHRVARSGSEAREWRRPSDPFMLVGWDRNDNGQYPPYDTGDLAVLEPPETCPGAPNKGCAAAPAADEEDPQDVHQKDDERAIYLANDVSHVELAHFTVRDYGRYTLTDNSGFFDLHADPEGDPPSADTNYVYVHDIETYDLNRDSNYNGRSSAINAFNWRAAYIEFENLLFQDTGYWVTRGGGSYGPDADGPFRWKNITANMDACATQPEARCDPDSVYDLDCALDYVCTDLAQCEPEAGELCKPRASTAFKMWGYYEGVEILDSVFDAQLEGRDAEDFELTGAGRLRAIAATPCTQDWTIRNNEFVDANVAVELVPESDGPCESIPRPLEDFIIDRNLARHDAPTGIYDAGFLLQAGSDDVPNHVIGEVTISNNMISSDDGLEACIEVLAGHDHPAMAEVPGAINIINNSCYGPITGTAALMIGARDGNNQGTMQQDIVVRNNLVGGKSSLAKNIAVSYVPTHFDADTNAWDPDGGYAWAGTTTVDLATWASASGELGARECVPTLLDDRGDSYPNGDVAALAGDLHISPADSCVLDQGSDASAFITHDYDGVARPNGDFDIGADEFTPRPLSEPPLRFLGAPEGLLAYGTQTTDMTVQTDQEALCSYRNAPASGACGPYWWNTFTSSGQTTSHATTLTGLVDGHSYRYCVRCENADQVANTDDYFIAFTVADPSVDLRGRWALDEGTGCTTADAANANTGTLAGSAATCPGAGPVWATGQSGAALDFDKDAHVLVLDDEHLDTPAGLTLSAWIKPSSFGDHSYGRVVSKQQYTGSYGPGFSLYLGDQPSGAPASSESLCANINTSWSGCAADGVITLDVWQHVALTLEPNADAGALPHRITFHVDGVAVGSELIAALPGENDAALTIGDREGFQRGFDGLIDEVRVYGRALSEDELALLAEP
ncbi:LamG domain-containing protein [Pseudenhygromyxa sp. WMMC2535]|uniref:LamG domain-containing protein n=1 Tax=Pseudenhygromyxa sp. WMMC2535 TaxID=2712867 RepID=UPI001554A34A|nr:LamG domain-containing protein [Pseudenhygromyxa sp. WMMC2535]NVB40676.1 LamG domain-containing protein [Pseudenhygromyxa sp. WMMC2535]